MFQYYEGMGRVYTDKELEELKYGKVIKVNTKITKKGKIIFATLGNNNST